MKNECKFPHQTHIPAGETDKKKKKTDITNDMVGWKVRRWVKGK